MVHKTKAALLNMLAGTEEGDAMAAVTLAIVSGDDIGLRALLKGANPPPGPTSENRTNGDLLQGWAGTSLLRPRRQRSKTLMMVGW